MTTHSWQIEMDDVEVGLPTTVKELVRFPSVIQPCQCMSNAGIFDEFFDKLSISLVVLDQKDIDELTNLIPPPLLMV